MLRVVNSGVTASVLHRRFTLVAFHGGRLCDLDTGADDYTMFQAGADLSKVTIKKVCSYHSFEEQMLGSRDSR